MEISSVTRAEVQPVVHELYSQSTGTWQYVVADVSTGKAVVIDSALDPQELAQGISTTSADQVLDLIQSKNYSIERILETQGAHCYKTAAFYLRQQLLDRTDIAPRVCVGKSLKGVERYFGRKQPLGTLGWNKHDDAFEDGATFTVGGLKVAVLSLQAHTAEHCGYVIGTHVFIGDAIFKPALLDKGVDTSQLWQSIQKLVGLSNHYEVHVSNGAVDRDDAARIGADELGQLCTTVSSIKTKYMFGLDQSDFLTLCREKEPPKQKPNLLKRRGRAGTGESSITQRPESPIELLRSLFSRRKRDPRSFSIASVASTPVQST
ncbi:hypothetical protein B0A48_13635 [Cryoendolithus antarcticus]|uniref:Metallo-beta-lactamase domain-containing protein n=1 Tax=Cryoendolithus antarcticus TaxID=1507870 RepID=A0A1V8SP50_9PEZI|nr:hypothetical protein B0A48_13635 [Cryoendolithus antarcticus]